MLESAVLAGNTKVSLDSGRYVGTLIEHPTTCTP